MSKYKLTMTVECNELEDVEEVHSAMLLAIANLEGDRSGLLVRIETNIDRARLNIDANMKKVGGKVAPPLAVEDEDDFDVDA